VCVTERSERGRGETAFRKRTRDGVRASERASGREARRPAARDTVATADSSLSSVWPPPYAAQRRPAHNASAIGASTRETTGLHTLESRGLDGQKKHSSPKKAKAASPDRDFRKHRKMQSSIFPTNAAATRGWPLTTAPPAPSSCAKGPVNYAEAAGPLPVHHSLHRRTLSLAPHATTTTCYFIYFYFFIFMIGHSSPRAAAARAYSS